MTFDYNEIAEVASEVLEEMGTMMTLSNNAIDVYDPATGKTIPGTPSSIQRRGVLLPFGNGQVNGPGGLIQVGDMRVILEAGLPRPSLEDQIILADGRILSIKGVTEVNPTGVTAIVYDLHVRM